MFSRKDEIKREHSSLFRGYKSFEEDNADARITEIVSDLETSAFENAEDKSVSSKVFLFANFSLRWCFSCSTFIRSYTHILCIFDFIMSINEF